VVVRVEPWWEELDQVDFGGSWKVIDAAFAVQVGPLCWEQHPAVFSRRPCVVTHKGRVAVRPVVVRPDLARQSLLDLIPVIVLGGGVANPDRSGGGKIEHAAENEHAGDGDRRNQK